MGKGNWKGRGFRKVSEEGVIGKLRDGRKGARYNFGWGKGGANGGLSLQGRGGLKTSARQKE